MLIFATTHSYDILLSTPSMLLSTLTDWYMIDRRAHYRAGVMLLQQETEWVPHVVCPSTSTTSTTTTTTTTTATAIQQLRDDRHDTALIEREHDVAWIYCTESIVCCTYSNGPVIFNLCEKDGVCPESSGYSLVKSIPTSNCSLCMDSNKRQVETQTHSPKRCE